MLLDSGTIMMIAVFIIGLLLVGVIIGFLLCSYLIKKSTRKYEHAFIDYKDCQVHENYKCLNMCDCKMKNPLFCEWSWQK